MTRKTKFIYAVVSLVIAFAIWTYVITVEKPGSEQTYYDVPVTLRNSAVLSDRGLMLFSDKAQTVTLQLSGNRSYLNKLNKGNITITADLSNVYQAGRQNITYTILYPGDVPSSAIEVVAKDPATITIHVVEKKTKMVPVVVQYIGSVPENYMTDKENLGLSLTEVEVSGPAETVDRVTQAIVYVDLTNKTETIRENYGFSLRDSSGAVVESDLLSVDTESIWVHLTIQRYKAVNLVLNVIYGGGATADNTTIVQEINSILVAGSDALIEELGDEIVLETINLETIAEDAVLNLPIRLKKGYINLTGQDTVEVSITFHGLVSQVVQVTDIRMENLPQVYQAEVIQNSVDVTIRAEADLLQGLMPEEVAIVVDMSGAELGTDTYRVRLLLPEGFEAVGAVGSYVVSVRVTAAGAE